MALRRIVKNYVALLWLEVCQTCHHANSVRPCHLQYTACGSIVVLATSDVVSTSMAYRLRAPNYVGIKQTVAPKNADGAFTSMGKVFPLLLYQHSLGSVHCNTIRPAVVQGYGDALQYTEKVNTDYW